MKIDVAGGENVSLCLPNHLGPIRSGGLAGIMLEEVFMRYLFCDKCGRKSEYKRQYGWGTLLRPDSNLRAVVFYHVFLPPALHYLRHDRYLPD